MAIEIPNDNFVISLDVTNRYKLKVFDLSVDANGNPSRTVRDLTDETVLFSVKADESDTDPNALILVTVTSHDDAEAGETTVTVDYGDFSGAGMVVDTQYFYGFTLINDGDTERLLLKQGVVKAKYAVTKGDS